MTDSMMNKAEAAGNEKTIEQVKRFPKLRKAFKFAVVSCCVVLAVVAGMEVYNLIFPDPWYIKALSIIGF